MLPRTARSTACRGKGHGQAFCNKGARSRGALLQPAGGWPHTPPARAPLQVKQHGRLKHPSRAGLLAKHQPRARFAWRTCSPT